MALNGSKGILCGRMSAEEVLDGGMLGPASRMRKESAAKWRRVATEPTRDESVEIGCLLHLRAKLANELVVNCVHMNLSPTSDYWDRSFAEHAQESATKPHLIENLESLAQTGAHTAAGHDGLNGMVVLMSRRQ